MKQVMEKMHLKTYLLDGRDACVMAIDDIGQDQMNVTKCEGINN